jgi:hypothetical protein
MTEGLVEGNVWKMWRDAPGFNQRYIGRISDDGKAITGQWEMTRWQEMESRLRPLVQESQRLTPANRPSTRTLRLRPKRRSRASASFAS